MRRYLARRLLWSAITLFGIAAITFGVVYLVPADPAEVMAGPHATAETVASIRAQLGLDRPLYVQFATFLARLVRGDLGSSYLNQRPVLEQIVERLPASVQLAVVAFLVQLAIGIPAGALAATYQNAWVDRLLTTQLVLGLSLPRFWLGVMLLFIFAFKLGWLPLGGYGGLRHMVLPALTVGFTGAAYYARLLRASMIETRRLEYVTTARAKGLTELRVVVAHVMRNAMLPVVTWAGIDFASFLSGMVIVEAVFGWPGVGALTYEAIQNVDLPLIVGSVVFSAVWVVLANLAVDILYVAIDPRISYD